MEALTEQMILTIRDAARKLTGAKRRAFQANVCCDYLAGDPRLTETVFGWSRITVAKGLRERNSGITIPDRPRSGRGKTELKNPRLAQDIQEIVEPQSQTDPKFQGEFQYTRLTAAAVRNALIDQKGYSSEHLPCENTVGVMLNRMNYKLRRVRKAKPQKNSPDRRHL